MRLCGYLERRYRYAIAFDGQTFRSQRLQRNRGGNWQGRVLPQDYFSAKPTTNRPGAAQAG